MHTPGIARGVLILAALTISGATSAVGQTPADAPRPEVRHHHHRHYVDRHYVDRRYDADESWRRCEEARHDRATSGTLLGAVGGGVLGSALGGGRLGGTLLGAGAGAVAGHEIAKGDSRC